MPPAEQPQTIAKCEEHRTAMFKKMDAQHNAQMEVLGEIKENMAFQKGRMAMLKAIGPWAAPILFVGVLGAIYWLKVKGWL